VEEEVAGEVGRRWRRGGGGGVGEDNNCPPNVTCPKNTQPVPGGCENG